MKKNKKNKKNKHSLEDFRPLNYNNYLIGIDYMFYCSNTLHKNKR